MIWAYAWKELTRRKSRTALTVLSIFFSIGLFVTVLAVLTFFKEAVSLPFKAAGADMVVETFVEPGPWKTVRLARHLGPLPVQFLDEIRALPEVQDASGLLLFWSWEEPRMVNIAGIDPKDMDGSCPLSRQALLGRPTVVMEGSIFSDTDTSVAILDKRYAEKFNLGIGSSIRLAGRNFKVIGIADMAGLPRAGQAEVFIPISQAQELVRESHEFLKDAGEFINMVLVKLKPGRDAKAVEGKIRALVAATAKVDPQKQVKIFTSENIIPDVTGVSALTQQMFKVIALIMLIGTALLVVKASLISVTERTSEIGIMKATGWQDLDVSKLILTETTLQGLLGGIAGCVVGYVIAYLYASTAVLKLPHGVVPYSCLPAAAPPQNIAVAMQVSWMLVLAAIVIAVGMGVLGGYIAAKRAASLHPAEALRRL